MKNLKNMLTGISLAAVLMVGATSAHAGLLLSDRATNVDQRCTVRGGLISELSGIIIIGAPVSLNGLLLSDRLVKTCEDTQRDGLLLSD